MTSTSSLLQGFLLSILSLVVACEAGPDDQSASNSLGSGGAPGAGGSASGSGGGGGGGFGTGGGNTGGSGTGSVGTGGGGGNVCTGGIWTAPTGALSATQIMAANAENNTNYHLLEGPVWLGGALYYSHFSNKTSAWPSQIKRYNSDGSVEVVIDSSGSNGLAIDATGNLLAATHDKKEISRYEIESKTRSSVVGEYLANPFNAPNDLTVAANGDVFFTDPDSDQKGAAPGGQDKARVYRWDGAAVTVVDDSFKPNGIAISPDGAFLFVTGGGYSGKLRKYPLVDGNPGAGEDVMALSEPDGLTFDCLGNLYVTEHLAVSNASRVRVFDPSHTEIATIAVGPVKGVGYSDVEAKATNVVFGGADGKTLFITATFSLWQIHLDVAGLTN